MEEAGQTAMGNGHEEPQLVGEESLLNPSWRIQEASGEQGSIQQAGTHPSKEELE